MVTTRRTDDVWQCYVAEEYVGIIYLNLSRYEYVFEPLKGIHLNASLLHGVAELMFQLEHERRKLARG